MTYKVLEGDCLTVLPSMPADYFTSLVTDPPAGISFMGKAWDKGGVGWVDWLTAVMKECLRVLKPGSHALIWALPRTSHKTMTAVENAGFEIRDVIYHLFGSGFPKGMDVSKALDKAAGTERHLIGVDQKWIKRVGSNHGESTYTDKSFGCVGPNGGKITAPATDEAKQWGGWNTALKPAVENWILARKPLSEKTIAANVLKWGTGALNIDACKIGDDVHWSGHKGKSVNCYGGWTVNHGPNAGQWKEGRYPANLICSEPELLGDVARYFYCAKASMKERNAGCEGFPMQDLPGVYDCSIDGSIPTKKITQPRQNNHPTVKPLALMRYLCRLITPPAGTVLDPFMGSGSTGVAALQEGFDFHGVEADTEYFKIAQARLASNI
jgi:hypothetical protein